MSEFLDKATEAHVAWKARLSALINRHLPLEEQIICTDNHCDLGRWIYGEGQLLEGNPIFDELKAKHTQFHESVALIVELVRREKYEEAKDELTHGAFSRLSSAVVAQIVKLKKAALVHH